MDIISRKDALISDNKYYFTGIPCAKNNHISKRIVSNYGCYECSLDNHRVSHVKYYQKNRSKLIQYSKDYRINNRNQAKKSQKKAVSKHLVKNRYKRNEYSAKYRASKKQATPSWYDKEQCLAIYQECGCGFQVDHIFPLNSDWVCGLHVHENLQILTILENQLKSNHNGNI